ncbi:MAG: hypothetical protein RIE16_08415, partial [Rhodospirillales bacterium]
MAMDTMSISLIADQMPKLTTITAHSPNTTWVLTGIVSDGWGPWPPGAVPGVAGAPAGPPGHQRPVP